MIEYSSDSAHEALMHELDEEDVLLACAICEVSNIKNKAFIIFKCGHVSCRRCFYHTNKACLFDNEMKVVRFWSENGYEMETGKSPKEKMVGEIL
jgi:hypothetical protein